MSPPALGARRRSMRRRGTNRGMRAPCPGSESRARACQSSPPAWMPAAVSTVLETTSSQSACLGEAIARDVLVHGGSGIAVQLGQVARVSLSQGPASIRTENAQLAAYVFVVMRDRAVGGFVADAQAAVARQVTLPAGYRLEWSGQFKYMERAKATLTVVVPLTLALIFVLLYLNFRRLAETLIVMLSLPFALVGGLWLVWWLGFNFSVAVAVGFIALAGVAAETGVVMLVYLDHAWRERLAQAASEDRPPTRRDMAEAIMEGAVERVPRKMMTVFAIMAGLAPIMWSHGTNSEVMQRIAAPMIAGMPSSTVLTLLVIPAVYALVKCGAIGAGAARVEPMLRPAMKGVHPCRT